MKITMDGFTIGDKVQVLGPSTDDIGILKLIDDSTNGRHFGVKFPEERRLYWFFANEMEKI